MATIEKRGEFWRVKVRRAGHPAQTRTFNNRTQAQHWARSVESDLDKGITVDLRTAQRTSLADILERYRREVTTTKRGAADENLRLQAMAQRPFAARPDVRAHELSPRAVIRTRPMITPKADARSSWTSTAVPCLGRPRVRAQFLAVVSAASSAAVFKI